MKEKTGKKARMTLQTNHINRLNRTQSLGNSFLGIATSCQSLSVFLSSTEDQKLLTNAHLFTQVFSSFRTINSFSLPCFCHISKTLLHISHSRVITTKGNIRRYAIAPFPLFFCTRSAFTYHVMFCLQSRYIVQ